MDSIVADSKTGLSPPKTVSLYSRFLADFQAQDFPDKELEIPGAVVHACALFVPESIVACGRQFSPCGSCFNVATFHTGQYTGKSKPMPEYHVKVCSFSDKVRASRVSWNILSPFYCSYDLMAQHLVTIKQESMFDSLAVCYDHQISIYVTNLHVFYIRVLSS